MSGLLMWRLARLAAGLALVSLIGSGNVAAQAAPSAITVTNPTLKVGQRQHTPDGRTDSPALSWGGVPPTPVS